MKKLLPTLAALCLLALVSFGAHAADLRGRRVAVVADWGGATVSPIK